MHRILNLCSILRKGLLFSNLTSGVQLNVSQIKIVKHVIISWEFGAAML